MFMNKINGYDNWILDNGVSSINVVNTPNLINNINRSYQSIESITGDIFINLKCNNDIYLENVYMYHHLK